MTFVKHVSVELALERSPSWTGDGDGGVAGARGEVEAEAEDVAMTTTDEAQGVIDQDSLRAEKGNESHDGDGDGDGNGNGNGEEDEEGRCGGLVVARRPSRSLSPLGSGPGSASRSLSDSNSHSHSRSRSSLREPLEMESSVATSWTQVDMDEVDVGGRPSEESDRERRPSGEVHCRASTDQLELEKGGIDGGAGEESKGPVDDTEVVSLSRVLLDRDGRSGGGERKEEVLVMQEKDLGEEWHPLRHESKAQSQEDGQGECEKGELEEDVGFVHAGSAHDTDQSLEMDEGDRWRTIGSRGRNRKPLRLEFKAPLPTENNEVYTSDYYSTLNSKKFETLQKSRQRPLIPHSAYYFGPPPSDSAYGTPPVGQIGVHHPREIVRVERDYAGGELTQFSPVFPLELEGRITPTQFHQTINDINEVLISAHSIRHAFIDNFLAVITLQLSTLFLKSHYKKEMRRLKKKIEELNTQLYNPVGLNILWPQKVAFLFLEIEYY